MTQIVFVREVLVVLVEQCRLMVSQMLAILRLKLDSDWVLGSRKLRELCCQEIIPKVRRTPTVP